MFSVTVRDHIAITHNSPGEVSGSAQRLHRAMFVVDATFRREQLDDDNVVVDIELASQEVSSVVNDLTLRNLNSEPEIKSINNSIELLARELTDLLAGRVQVGALGEKSKTLTSISVTLHESNAASATYDRAL
ncbi:6-pyruvoyl trahydropterin synthase family protein [Streptomyces sp. NPDC017991]|uniref:6-pyruvoyl trahydropterin synthase family protein n=1 Tax=Streptomyces sp. NPDC017991 TaxID=3365026 RepID=UPI0037B4D86D